MSDVSLKLNDGYAPAAKSAGGEVGDYFALLKPRVMSLVVFTSFVGLMVAPGGIHPFLGFVVVLAIAIGAGASGALNMWFDADIDGLMQRTVSRPIPQGRVLKEEALTLGVVLSALSILVLGLATNWLAAGLLAFTIGFYLFVYTMWLKRRTPQNIVIGGAAGAFPPMIGWAAVTGSVTVESVLLFLIIFMWTPPHFWALALYRARDYERVQVPMLPVVAGASSTRLHILVYSFILVALSLVPPFVGLGGLLYLIVSAGLGAGFLYLAFEVYLKRQGASSDRAAKRLFGYSILYLFCLYLALLVEQLVPGLMMPFGLT